MSTLIYFDHHATTPLDPQVLEAMLPWFRDRVGNAASIGHQAGRRARQAVDDARETIAACLECDPAEIVFTSGATEADNLAIKGVCGCSRTRRQLITTAAEHRAILDPARRLKREGNPVTVLPVDEVGRVAVDAVAAALTDQTALVSVMLANNEVGTISPVAEIARICHGRGVPVHTDAAQAIGKIAVTLKQLPVDLLSFTAHKLHGPQGIGALFVRKSEWRPRLVPLMDGGGHEGGLRSGTLPVALIVGFAKAVELSVSSLEVEASRLAGLRDALWTMLSSRLTGLSRNGDPDGALPGNLNVTIADVDGDALLVRLAQSRLCISSGAACSSANPEPSHVLRAMGRSDAQARGSLRFGLGRFNTPDEIPAAAEIVVDVVNALRGS